jgi:probable HAF family extracellular repeat protein
MRASYEPSPVHGGRWKTRCACTVAALALCSGTALAGAQAPVSGKTTYQVIQLSDSQVDTAEINARNQVAFKDAGDGNIGYMARFYDGTRVWTLGTLGGKESGATAVNDAGQVAGYSELANRSDLRAFLWRQTTGMADLGLLGQPPGRSLVSDLNNHGQVVGYSTVDGTGRAFLWSRRSGMRDLGTLGGDLSLAVAINNAGQVAGESYTTSNMLEGFIWTRATGMVGIGSLGGGFSSPTAMNSRGQIVGYSNDASGNYRPFVWTPGKGMIGIGEGGRWSVANDINDKGTVAGIQTSTGAFRAFVWSRQTGLLDIGTFGGGSSVAYPVNNRGQVGGAADLPDGTVHAFVWTRAEGLVDLNTRIPGAPPGLTLRIVLDISDSGAMVVNSNTGLVLLLPGARTNVAPVAGPVKLHGAARTDVPLSFSASFKDADRRDTHEAKWSWGDGNEEAGIVAGGNGAGSVTAKHAYRAAGIYTARLTVTDSSGKSVTVKRKVVVRGPGAYVAGEGEFLSPPGANKAAPRQSGVASFAFLSAAAKDAHQPDGKATIHFRTAGLDFRSERFDSLSVSGGRVQYHGSGTLNGAGNYKFTLTAVDGTKAAGGMDRFRIRIWHLQPDGQTEVVDYDNHVARSGMGADDEGSTAVGAIGADPT